MKKGSMPLAVIVILIVLAVFFFIYASGILSEGGMLRRSASAVDEAIQKVPGVGDDEINQIQVPQPPKEVADAFASLITALNRNTASAPCIAEYGAENDKGGLPDMKGYTVEFLSRTEPGPKFITQLRGPDGRLADVQYVNNDLCVVGGEIYSSDIYLGGGTPVVSINEKGEVDITHKIFFDDLGRAFDYDEENINWAAKNFYTNWIAETDWTEHPAYRPIRNGKQRILTPDYTNPRHIIITDKASMSVDYGDGLKAFGKEDGGLLYVAGEGRVCLMATTGDAGFLDCDAHPEGLEQDCLDTPKEIENIIKAVGSCQR